MRGPARFRQPAAREGGRGGRVASSPVVTIVAVGDSTTAGTPGFKSPLEAPPDGSGDVESQYGYWLTARHPDWRVLNRGVNGERSDQIRARFERDAVRERRRLPASDRLVAVIVAGVNDIYAGRSAEIVCRELQAMYEMARAAGIPVVAGTILPYDTATPVQNARMRAVNAWIREYADAHEDVVFSDTRAAVARRDNPDALAASPDGLHPLPAGYRAMALVLEEAIGDALRT